VTDRCFVLASRSPRRRELLSRIVPDQLIRVVPPRSAQEAGFDDCRDRAAIENRLLEIARAKARDVLEQVRERGGTGEPPHDRSEWTVIAADTIIVATDAAGALQVLGQPPAGAWRETVRRWFLDCYAGRTHSALSGLRVECADGRSTERVVETEVRFVENAGDRLEWYLDTGEPQGKAGGYALQGAGSIFIAGVQGSLSNVIGLPLEALIDALSLLDFWPVPHQE
jgi:septum formation protein